MERVIPRHPDTALRGYLDTGTRIEVKSARENSDHLELFITVDNTKVHQGQEN